MVPAAIAVAMAVMFGVFGSGAVQPAQAFISGDVCPGATVMDATHQITPTANFDGQGNDIYVIQKNTSYGLNFRIQDVALAWFLDFDFTDSGPPSGTTGTTPPDFSIQGVFPGPNAQVDVDSETGSGRITSQAQAFQTNERDHVKINGIYGNLWDVPDITHVLINPGVITQVTQTYNPLVHQQLQRLHAGQHRLVAQQPGRYVRGGCPGLWRRRLP